jgi:hypothetical protein
VRLNGPARYFLLSLLASAHSSALNAGTQAPQLTRMRAIQMSTSQLARLLLPNEPEGKFTSHELLKPYLPGEPLTMVQFFARPSPRGSDLCFREVTIASLEPTVPWNETTRHQDLPVRFTRASQKVQIAAAPQCRAGFGAFMAWVQPEREVAGAQEALRRLIALQEGARKNVKPTDITCRTDIGENVCAQPFAKLLSDLPIDRIHNIGRHQLGWRFSVMPNGPGPGLYWNVLLHDDQDKIELEWNVVPPF